MPSPTVIKLTEDGFFAYSRRARHAQNLLVVANRIITLQRADVASARRRDMLRFLRAILDAAGQVLYYRPVR